MRTYVHAHLWSKILHYGKKYYYVYKNTKDVCHPLITTVVDTSVANPIAPAQTHGCCLTSIVSQQLNTVLWPIPINKDTCIPMAW